MKTLSVISPINSTYIHTIKSTKKPPMATHIPVIETRIPTKQSITHQTTPKLTSPHVDPTTRSSTLKSLTSTPTNQRTKNPTQPEPTQSTTPLSKSLTSSNPTSPPTEIPIKPGATLSTTISLHTSLPIASTSLSVKIQNTPNPEPRITITPLEL